MELILRVTLFAVGVVNALPMVAAFEPSLLQRLYGLSVVDPNLLVLLRHRAVLFGLLGLLLMAAAFDAKLYNVAVVGGLVSMLAYVLIAWQTGGYNAQMNTVVIVDAVASVVLAGVYGLWLFMRQA
jgi:hypothetical protein